MPFAERWQGAITALYAGPQRGRAEEGIADGHPDVVAFRAPLVAAGLILPPVPGQPPPALPTVFPED